MNHVLSAGHFTHEELNGFLLRAAEMEEILNKGGSHMAEDKILATLFYEPSTRTRLSFETAMYRLGGHVISETDVNFSSQTKGEVLADTIRITGGYSDIIAIRSKNKGDAALAAQYSPVPILNGGDGAGEHPTQGLLDLYTIAKHFKLGEEPLHVAFVGDLKYGRTVHSCCTLLRNFEGVKFSFVAPESLQIPDQYYREGENKYSELNNELLTSAQVIYDTRIQKERLEDPSVYDEVKNAFVFTPEVVSKMDEEAILMHPLPRVNEITLDVDKMPQAKYFEQAANGVPTRMALIAECLNI